MKQRERIVATPGTLGGKPRIAGTRVSVALILEELGAGSTIAEIVDCYPGVTDEDVRAAIAFAVSRVQCFDEHAA
jgi:uncharacterized protein (DUF433 family)